MRSKFIFLMFPNFEHSSKLQKHLKYVSALTTLPRDLPFPRESAYWPELRPQKVSIGRTLASYTPSQ